MTGKDYRVRLMALNCEALEGTGELCHLSTRLFGCYSRARNIEKRQQKGYKAEDAKKKIKIFALGLLEDYHGKEVRWKTLVRLQHSLICKTVEAMSFQEVKRKSL